MSSFEQELAHLAKKYGRHVVFSNPGVTVVSSNPGRCENDSLLVDDDISARVQAEQELKPDTDPIPAVQDVKWTPEHWIHILCTTNPPPESSAMYKHHFRTAWAIAWNSLKRIRTVPEQWSSAEYDPDAHLARHPGEITDYSIVTQILRLWGLTFSVQEREYTDRPSTSSAFNRAPLYRFDFTVPKQDWYSN